MSGVWWIVVAGTCLAVWAVRHLLRYPGGWSFAFHGQYRADREALADAYREVRRLKGADRQEMGKARSAVAREEKAYRDRISQAETALRQLRTPPRGARVAELGRIVLHENAVLVGGDEVPLAGLRVRFDLARSAHVSYVYLTQADGHEHMESFEEAQFAEEQVRAFSVRVQNAAAAAQRLRGLREKDIGKLEAELSRARADTEPMEAAREQLEQTRAWQDADPRLPKARAALDDARDAWQQLAGRRPR
jgi:hypothetical protein